MSCTRLLAIAAFAVASLFAPASVRADRTKVSRGPVPSWVVAVPVDAGAAAPPDARGVFDELVDRQALHGPRPAVYRRSVQRVLSHDGAARAASFQLYFEPAYQRLELHRVAVHRGAEVIDSLELEQLRVAAVQADTYSRMYSGEVEVSYEIPDVRAGDRVELAYTVYGTNPVFGDAIMGGVSLQYSVPVGRIHFRALVPRGTELAMRSLATQAGLERRPAGRFDALTYDARDVAGRVADGQRPSWYFAWPAIQYSSYRSWAEVAAWAHDVYRPAMQADSEVMALAASIRAAHSSRRQQIVAATRFVQDEIRYVAVPVGEHSHRPHPVAEVLARRLGDCKDKSALLVTLLEQLGVPADPVLVDIDTGKSLTEVVPMPYAFDHVIVRAHDGAEALWIDATQSGTREPLSTAPPYHWGLAARPDATALHEIPHRAPHQPDSAVVESYSSLGDGWFRLVTVTTLRGHMADSFRARLGAETRESIGEGYLNHYAALFPSVEAEGEIEVDEDPAANQITVTERYRLRDFYKNGKRALDFTEAASSLYRPHDRKRTAPFAQPYPLLREHTIRVYMPGPVFHLARTDRVQSEYFTYTLSSRVRDHWAEATARMESHSDHVPASAITGYVADLDRVDTMAAFEFDPPGFEGGGGMSTTAGLIVVAGMVGLAFIIVLVANRRRSIDDVFHRVAAEASPGYAPAGYTPPGYAPPAAPSPAEAAPPAAPPHNTAATVALWVGIGSVLLSMVPLVGLAGAIVALVFGAIGMVRARPRGATGNGRAIAGFALGTLALIISVMVIVGAVHGFMEGVKDGMGETDQP